MPESKRNRINIALTAGLLAAILSSPAVAGEIHLKWAPAEDAAAYRIYYGTRSGDYNRTYAVGNVTAAVLDGLQDCTEYFVAIKAYNAAGESPEFSNEISGWSRPGIEQIDPSDGNQGDQFTMNVRGGSFAPGAELTWDDSTVPRDLQGNPLLRIEGASVLSCSQIQVLVTIEPPARGFRAMPIGDHALTFGVTNPDGISGRGTTVLEVGFDPHRADINRSDASTTNRLDGKDLSWLAYAYGTDEGAPRYNPDADLNGDGLIDGDDLALLSPGFGMCWSGSTWRASACP